MFRFAQRICVFTLASAGVFAQVIQTPAVARTTGMIGLAEGQTARINVLNPGLAAPAVGATCTAMLEFLNGSGTVLKSTAVTVAPGHAALFDLFSDADLSLALDTRTEIRAVILPPAVIPVVSISSTPMQPAACTLIGTLEIFDSLSKRTQAVLGGFHDVPPAPTATSTSSQ